MKPSAKHWEASEQVCSHCWWIESTSFYLYGTKTQQVALCCFILYSKERSPTNRPASTRWQRGGKLRLEEGTSGRTRLRAGRHGAEEPERNNEMNTQTLFLIHAFLMKVFSLFFQEVRRWREWWQVWTQVTHLQCKQHVLYWSYEARIEIMSL